MVCGMTRYHVIDRVTGDKLGDYGDRKAANRRADVLDREYGAVRHYVKEVMVPDVQK